MARGKKSCKMRSCGNAVHARGLCQKCYDKIRKRKSARSARAGARRTCKAPGCDRAHHAQGYCQRCYDLYRKDAAKPSDAAGEKGARPARVGAAAASGGDPVCSTPGCKNVHHARGYCKRCYSRLRRSGALSRDAGGHVRADRGARGKGQNHAGAAGGTEAKRNESRERVELLKRRHERMKREIARIAESFDTDVQSEEEE